MILDRRKVKPTEEEMQAYVRDVEDHKAKVRFLLDLVCKRLEKRSEVHDASKYSPEEADVYAIYTPKFKDVKYGSDEYNAILKEMDPALKHHLANNSHHPEYYNGGVNGMDLLDLIEMVCDWKAASQRRPDSNLLDSVEVSKKRFNLDDQLCDIITNTIKRYFL